MKKITLLLAMILVLMSSIVFSACGDEFKDLKITSSVDEIKLVLDDKDMSSEEIIFELSGAKKWGEINIDSQPSGLAKIEYEIKDKFCAVVVQALYPTGDGAKLTITHLGSGKSLSVPLIIGQKLQTVTSSGKDYIIKSPTFEDGENVKKINIPTRQLLNCLPSNYTDTIVWQNADPIGLNGIDVVSYNEKGERVTAFDTLENAGLKLKGYSNAVKTFVEISRDFDANQTIVINPISILGDEAILHKDVNVEVCVMDLLQKQDIKITSDTHGGKSYKDNDGLTYDNNELNDLVLISNPDPNSPRGGALNGGYDLYSTALIDLKLETERRVQQAGLPATEFLNISEVKDLLPKVYDIQVSSNIDGLRLEKISFDKFRAIATNTCVGQGYIKVMFTPNDCVGDIETFSIDIPCVVGERATSFKATNNGQTIQIVKEDDYNFKSTTALRDSNSIGQSFKFETLSTNTLQALKGYKIKIHKYLLYIDESGLRKEGDDRWYSRNIIDKNGNQIELTEDILKSDRRYRDQVSILKDGRNITFYAEGDYFVSEPLTSRQTIYMKWVRVNGRDLGSMDLGIQIFNIYDNSFDIKNHGFEDTIITYDLSFSRQRTIETVSYIPVKLTIGAGLMLDTPNDAGDDWQFYFVSEMLNNENEDNIYYGFKIEELLGLNGSQLNNAELEDIELTIEVDGNNLGVMLFDYNNFVNSYVNSYPYQFDTNNGGAGFENIIIVGRIDDKQALEFGDYSISIRQDTNEITSCNVRIYKDINTEDIQITLPHAEFNGDLLQYENVIINKDENEYYYERLNAKPSDWDIANQDYPTCNNYYEYISGYINVALGTPWDANKMYYKKIDWLHNDNGTGYQNYYENVGGQYVMASANWSESKSYYKSNAQGGANPYFELSNNDIMYLSNSYILSTSKNYDVKVEIANEDFSSKIGQTASKTVVTTEGGCLNNNIITMPEDGSWIQTSGKGSFNTTTGKQNYVKLTYTIKTNTYDYYKINHSSTKDVNKSVYIYIYEPVKTVTFSDTQLYKYSYNHIENNALKDYYGKHTLNVKFDDNSEDILSYTNIKWVYTEDGILEFKQDALDSATITFFTSNAQVLGTSINGRIVGVITQFGWQQPIYCDYNIQPPVLTDYIQLDTQINSFASGGGYINLKVGETIDIKASAYSTRKDANGNLLPVSLPGFSYMVCSSTGYSIDSIASIDSNGELTATSAGRAKLIIYAKDRFKNKTNIVNYFNTSYYLQNDAYIIVDIIVSDGSVHNPFLIASAEDFKKIKDDYYIWDGTKKINAEGDTSKTNDYHYALIGDIDLNGQAITFENFEGTISSFQENSNSNNKFNIYGIIINESNPNLFQTLNANKDDLPVLNNVNLHLGIDYKATSAALVLSQIKTIGLVGTNKAKIENITITVSGQIDANNLTNNYIIGSMVAINAGNININDPTLVGVQGSIKVINSGASKVVLGGVVGENQGVVTGANNTSSISSYVEDDNGDYVFIGNEYIIYDESLHAGQQRYKYIGDKVGYEVYYDNQGATADVDLQVTSVGDESNSAVGGLIGYNTGAVTNVYVMGSILGVSQVQDLRVSNIGGLIGKNDDSNGVFKITTQATEGQDQLTGIAILGDLSISGTNFQVNNSYSSAIVKGKNNVGGAIGYDNKGSYNKVYYEMYTIQNSIKGQNNVGGLIGGAYDSTLNYCYANNFAWGYQSSVSIYDIEGIENVGGLIGYAESSRGSFNYNADDGAMDIANSLASVTLTGNKNVSGLVGRLDKYGAIYTAYFYGVIDPSIDALNSRPIVKMFDKSGATGIEVGNIPYKNVYSIVNGSKDNTYYEGEGFGSNPQYNNGEPYIEYNGSNLVSLIPTKIEINKAFETIANGGYYNPNNNKMYKSNNAGEYYLDEGLTDDEIDDEYKPYNSSMGNIPRYSLMAQVVPTGDANSNNSDYRAKAIVLYYYQFTDMSGENAIRDLYELNTINMHELVADEGIIVLPTTLKRFTLRTSDSSIVSILSGGRLLLNNEGQVTITLVSTLNPSVSASFVVIVRSKMLEFNLYSNANLRDEYKIANETISIVKNSSKIIYADYSSIIQRYNSIYNYKTPTNMRLKFTITYNGILPDGKTIRDCIILNEDTYDAGNDCYTIDYGTPITITVKEYVSGTFTITAIPYVIATYNGTPIEIEQSSYYNLEFSVTTKRGANAINIDKTQLDMMPADESVDVGVKVNTDIKLSELYVVIEKTTGDKTEILDPTKPTDPNAKIKFVNMLDISSSYSLLEDKISNNDERNIKIDISSTSWDNNIQSLNLTFNLNQKSYYIDEAFTLQVAIYVLASDGTSKIATTLYINVKPQQINSVIPINYRMKDLAGNLEFDNFYQSPVIRPGAINVITIDVAPSVSVFEYLEIIDKTTEDKILLQQVDENLDLPENMDVWTTDGIKLKKYDSTNKYDSLSSRFYVLARLPKLANANITHILEINVYDKNDKVLYTTNLTVEAVMYPTVVMKYIDPNGIIDTTADTRDDNIDHNVESITNLAMGVEAGMVVETYNIDEGTLRYSISIYDGINEVTDSYKDIVKLEYKFDRYVLLFNQDKESRWIELLGKNIKVSFTASKSLNGVTETCKATISFKIQRIVIHSVSMDRTTSKDAIHGNWDTDFSTYFYFSETDISYYFDGSYWNVKYDLNNTNPDDYAGTVHDDMIAINNILKDLNSWNKDGVNLYFGDLDETDVAKMLKLQSAYNDGLISIRNVDNKFIFNAKTDSNINDMKLLVDFKLEYDTGRPKLTSSNVKSISNSFGFDVTKPTNPFGEYILVHNAEEFNSMIAGEFYQLANDILLTNYTPINVAIGGLNGDGFTIRIENSQDPLTGQRYDAFNISQLVLDYASKGMYIGLFGTLDTNTIVQNLQVQYGAIGSEIEINLDQSESIKDQQSNNIYFGGIAGVNLGVITNVRVLGKFILKSQYISVDNIDFGGIAAINGVAGGKVATITNSTVELTMKSMALIGGISGTNYGKIANTKFTGCIESSDTNQYVPSVLTAGFVVDNKNGAYISLSYVDCNTPASEYDIKSVGRTAGFVLDNSGTINNCYIIRTSIISQGNIGGFVYQSTGTISNSYANAELSNSLYYKEFINKTDNVGDITNCYVVTDSTINLFVNGLTKISSVNKGKQESYLGFIFAKKYNGLWTISDDGPKLANAGFIGDRLVFSDILNIYDLATYDGYLATQSGIIEGRTYRLVRDIDFLEQGCQDNPSTYNKILGASFEGNDMVLSNYNIYKTGDINSIGLFAEIRSYNSSIFVRNLNLQPASIKATGSNMVGALAGLIDSVGVYNIGIDSRDLLILGKNAVGGMTGIIKGNFEVIGVSSNVSGFATYTHNTGSRYNLYMGKNEYGYTIIDNIKEVSYVGAIAGIADGYNNASLSTTRSIDKYFTISDLSIDADLQLIGETVGGAIGLVGQRTLLNNVNYNLDSATNYKGVYISGGLVGENRGIIRNSNIYAYTYQNNVKQLVDTSACFNNFARVNGAIVGLNIGGLINNCTSEINVYTTEDLSTAGGIVGRNIRGNVYGCEVLGRVSAYFAGAIAGTDYSYITVTTQNGGYGTPTSATQEVYSIVQNNIEYDNNCLLGDLTHEKDTLYKDNVFSDKFIKDFVNIKGSAYSYNYDYVDKGATNLVQANIIYGLVVGLTDGEYTTTINGVDTTTGILSYNNEQLEISLKLGASSSRESYKISDKDGAKSISPICMITGVNFNNHDVIAPVGTENSANVLFIYIVACEKGSYEFWTSSVGYSQQYIVMTDNALDVGNSPIS